MSYYTLKLVSISWPIPANQPEFAHMVEAEADKMKANGWEVAIGETPEHQDGRYTYDLRRHLECTRQIGCPEGIEKRWDDKMFDLPPASISVIFSDAIAYSGKSEMAPNCVMGRQSRFEIGTITWYMSRGPASRTAAITVEGGCQVGDDNKRMFMRVLSAWDRKFKMARKLPQLVGLAWDHNQGGIDRLEAEILEYILS